jgi:hypothetical protein
VTAGRRTGHVDGPEASVGQRSGQPPGRDRLGSGRVGERGLQSLLQLALDVLAHRLTPFAGQPPGLLRQRVHDLVALRGQDAELVARYCLLRLPQGLAEPEQLLEPGGAVAGQEVGEPCAGRGLAQRLQGCREVAVTPASLPRAGVTGRGEGVQREPVELVGDVVEGHLAVLPDPARARSDRPAVRAPCRTTSAAQVRLRTHGPIRT